MPKTGVVTRNDIVVWKEKYRDLVDSMKEDDCEFCDVYTLLHTWLDREFDKEYPDADDD